MQYELMFLVGENKKTEFENIKKDIHQLVEKNGGKWIGESIDFERKLAYKIKHQWRGVYSVQRFELTEKDDRSEDENEVLVTAIQEITNQMNLQRDVLRYIIVKTDDLPELSVFVRKNTEVKKEKKEVLKEKSGKIDRELEKALNI